MTGVQTCALPILKIDFRGSCLGKVNLEEVVLVGFNICCGMLLVVLEMVDM